MREATAKLVRINTSELTHMLLSSVVAAFVLSWRDWGQTTVDVTMGLTSLIVSFLITMAVLMLRLAVQKRFALREGYFITYVLHKWGVALSVFVAFFFNGIVPYVAPGEIQCKESHRMRLGAYRYGLNYKDLAKISIAGTLIPVLLMIIIKPLYIISDNFFILKIIHVCAAIAFFGLIPIPGADGFHIFYYRRWLWVFMIVFVGIYFALILYAGVFSYVIASVIALFSTWIYVKQID